MKVIILGGNGVANRIWNENMAMQLNAGLVSTKIITYDHWTSKSPMIDPTTEAKKLQHVFSSSSDSIVIAKSAGIIVTLYAFSMFRFKPKRCIFVGLPISWATQNSFELKKMLTDYDVPTLFIQQVDDPYGSYQQVLDLLDNSRASNYDSCSIQGNDHGYTDFIALQQLIMKYKG